MTNPTFFAEIRNLIGRDEIPAALEQLRILLEHSPKLDEVLLQSGRFENIRKQIRQGIVSYSEATVTQNQIRFGLLELVSEIERSVGATSNHADTAETIALRAEVEHAISIVNSKNMVTGSTISAGGNIHIGDIVYQSPPPAVAQPLNEHLSKALIQAIRPHSTNAAKFWEKAQTIPNWETNAQICNKAKEILAYSFVGVIGIQLSKLFAIGKEDFSENIQNKFIEKCLQIAKRSLDLIVFALVSQIWESQKTTPRTFSPAQTRALQDFFDRPFEPAIAEQVRLFQTLHELFVEHGLLFPFPELQDFAAHFQQGSVFQHACAQLQQLSERLDKKACTPADCTAAEHALADGLGSLHFLAACRMASIKRIGYWQIRTAEPKFLHRYAALGIDSKANVDAEKINYTHDTVHTDSVLLYRSERYQENLNLSPFVIDYNALTAESGAKICFYRARALSDDSLDFCFLEDNSLVNVTWKGILRPGSDANELLLLAENRKMHSLDGVIEQFRAARNSILGEAFNFDDL